jgi:hypothetical protein
MKRLQFFNIFLNPLLKLWVTVEVRSFDGSYLWNDDLHGPKRNAFDVGNSITRASGRGLGPGNQVGPVKWYRDIWRVLSGAQKILDFLGPSPSHLPKYWICLYQVQGRINQRSIGIFKYKSSCVLQYFTTPLQFRSHTNRPVDVAQQQYLSSAFQVRSHTAGPVEDKE